MSENENSLQIKEEELQLPQEDKTISGVDELIRNKLGETTEVKDALNLFVTHDAMQDEDTVNTALKEKKEEIKYDFEARRYQAEAEKIKQEKEKELAELDKVISAKQKEIEQLKVES